MASKFPPAREADLVTWSANFGSKIQSAPTTYGLTAAQSTAYNTLQAAFVSAFNLAQADATRSPMNVELKNVAKHNLVANIRLLGGIVQRFPGTTNAMRIDLGLPPRMMPSPIPAPASEPNIDVTSVSGRLVSVRLHDPAHPTKRGKPPGVDGASVFSFIGATPPVDITQWKFEGNTTRTKFDIAFDSSLAAGATVQITAFWFNERKQSGPAATPISVTFGAAGVSSNAA